MIVKKKKNQNLKFSKIREVVQYGKYGICILSVVTACYGFWGCLYPDLTFVDGTYRVVTVQDAEQNYCGDKDTLYADMLNGKVQVTFRIKLWELFQNRRGKENG